MRLVFFDDGAGPRPGLVRASWVVDLRALFGEGLPSELGVLTQDADWRQRLAGAQVACIARTHLRRLDEVRVLDERSV